MSELEFTDNEAGSQDERNEAITLGLPEPWPHSAVETEAIVAGAMSLRIRAALKGDVATIAPGQCMSPEETISAACAVDACGSEAEDTLSAIPSWPAIIERVAAGWSRFLPEGKKKSPLDMAGAGWRWSERYELWVGPHDAHY